jgi:hypothetical protein
METEYQNSFSALKAPLEDGISSKLEAKSRMLLVA